MSGFLSSGGGDGASLSVVHGGVRVIKSGDTVYVRTAWTTAYDLIQTLSLHVADAATYANNQLQLLSIYTIPVATPDTAVAATSPTETLHNISDDACPVYFNGSYMGGDHGPAFGITITVSGGHGKTAADIGSRWTDDSSKIFYIINLGDNTGANPTTKLTLIEANQGTATAWSFPDAVNTKLTHSSGATHTGVITLTSQVGSQQIKPGVVNVSKSVLMNGLIPITADGVYSGDSVDFRHTYDIIDVPSAIAYSFANIDATGANPPVWNSATITAAARITNTYHYASNGSCTVATTQTFNQAADTNGAMIGGIQSAAITPPTSGTRYEYVPRSTTYQTPLDITSAGSDVTIAYGTAGDYANMLAPPDRFLQYTKTSGGAFYYGMSLGYCPRIGDAKPASRAIWCNAGRRVLVVDGNSRKQYPKLADMQTVTAGEKFDCVAFRCPVNYSLYPNATNVSWYEVGDDVYVNIDYHQTKSEYIQLPQEFVGRQVELVENLGTITINSPIVTPDGISVSATTYGSAIVRLVKSLIPTRVVADSTPKLVPQFSLDFGHKTLNGTSDLIRVRQPFNAGVGQPYSLAICFRLDADITTGTHYLWTMQDANNTAAIDYLQLRKDGDYYATPTPQFMSLDSLSGNVKNVMGAGLTVGSWYTLVVTYDSSHTSAGVKIYLNGTLQAVADSSNGTGGAVELSQAGDWVIGGMTGANYTACTVAWVKAWQGILTPAQVAEISGATQPWQTK